MKYGYARVSTDGQSIDAQVRQLKAAGARQVFREVASGAKTDRAQLRRVLAHLDAGDVLMVTRLDRLARSTRDLLNTLAAIAGRVITHPNPPDRAAVRSCAEAARASRMTANAVRPARRPVATMEQRSA